jgi:hypothetical protein
MLTEVINILINIRNVGTANVCTNVRNLGYKIVYFAEYTKFGALIDRQTLSLWDDTIQYLINWTHFYVDTHYHISRKSAEKFRN